MDDHVLRQNLETIKTDIASCFKELKDRINSIAALDKAEPARDLLGFLVKLVDIDSDYVRNMLTHLSDSTIVPKENVSYKYILVTIHDNDFWKTLDRLGEVLVHTVGEKFKPEILCGTIPSLFSSLSAVCQNSGLDMDHVKKYIKVLYTDDDIIAFLKNYGMDFSGEEYGCFENKILKDDPKFKDVVHLSGNAEVLIVKLAYNSDNEYVESLSDWCVF